MCWLNESVEAQQELKKSRREEESDGIEVDRRLGELSEGEEGDEDDILARLPTAGDESDGMEEEEEEEEEAEGEDEARAVVNRGKKRPRDDSNAKKGKKKARKSSDARKGH